MKSSFIKLLPVSLIGIILFQSWFILAQTDEAPASIIAVLIMKVAAFEKNISSGQDVNVFVLNAPDVADELHKGIGSPIGNAILKSVDSDTSLPEKPSDILYIGNTTHINRILDYTRLHNILSITGSEDLVSKGATVYIGIGNNGKPIIKLNLTSTIEEELSWNPAIMKVAKTVK